MKAAILVSLVIILWGCSRSIHYIVKADKKLNDSLAGCKEKINPEGFPGFDEALKHAPILWFEDNEEYFPTLPFFSAFDNIDNNSNGSKDLQDLQEIAPLDATAPSPDDKVSWDTLNTWYRSLTRETRKSLGAVFYRIRDTVETSRIKRIISSDEQLWGRLKESDWFQIDSADNFKVYEYYFYYIKDEGLQGHAQDLESVFIFVPKTSHEFRILVGPGHLEFVPNNVLVYDTSAIPDRFNSHPHILIELGGHSNAPDIKGDGNFDLGVDANWHTEILWGTRDIQAITGRGATGTYQNWMSFQRDTTNRVFPPDPKLHNHKDRFCYRLLPVETFKSLDDSLVKYRQKQSNALQDTLKKKLKILVDNLQLSSAGLANLSGSVFDRMSYWTRKSTQRVKRFLPIINLSVDDSAEATLDNKRHQVWEQKDYQNKPSWIFRNHVYRPRIVAFGFWTHLERPSKPEFRLAWFVPAWAAAPIKIDGVIELHMGLRLPIDDKNWVIAGYFERFYTGRIFSWYGNISWMNNRRELETSNWAIGAGVSLLPPFINPISDHPFLGTPFRWIRIRLGLRYAINWDFIELANPRIVLQLGIHY